MRLDHQVLDAAKERWPLEDLLLRSLDVDFEKVDSVDPVFPHQSSHGYGADKRAAFSSDVAPFPILARCRIWEPDGDFPVRIPQCGVYRKNARIGRDIALKHPEVVGLSLYRENTSPWVASGKVD